MIIEYDINCFERTLYITMPDVYAGRKEDILSLLGDYYDAWHNCDEIEDEEVRAYVHDSCLEEYMIDCLVMDAGYQVLGYDTIGWSEDDEYIDEKVLKEKLSRNLGGAELITEED